MHTPKLRPPLGACEIPKQGRSKDKCTSCCSSLRWWLTVWACGRLLVSVLWTVVLLFVTFKDYMSPNERYSQDHSILAIRYLIFTFGVIATLAQLVEFGMLVTFIVAGIKRSAFLYRAYFRYCILTLIIYIIAMTLCFTLNYRHVHFIGDIYLTYQFQNIFEDVNSTCIIVFGIAVSLNICLEILLIYLIKRLINKYKDNEDYVAGETF